MKNAIIRLCRAFLPVVLLAACSCTESEEIIKRKFDIIIADDMKAILEDVDTAALLDRPYVDILEYVEYKEGVFIRRAVVDFYFLKTLEVKITRKYRYQKRLGLWDRYYNKYFKYGESAGTESAEVAEPAGERVGIANPAPVADIEEAEKRAKAVKSVMDSMIRLRQQAAEREK